MGTSEGWSEEERNRQRDSKQIEENLGHQRQTTVFVGGIPPGVSDETISSLLQTCGEIIEWRRVTDASNAPKSFGFAQFASSDGLLRALRILDDLPLLGEKRVMIRMDEQTQIYLRKYTESLSLKKLEQTSKEADMDAVSQCLVITREQNLVGAREAMFSRLKQVESGSLMQAVIPKLGKDAPEEGEVDENDPAPQPKSICAIENVRLMLDDVLHRKEKEEDRMFYDQLSKWESREDRILHRLKTLEEELIDEKLHMEEFVCKERARLLAYDDRDWMLSYLNQATGITEVNINDATVPLFYITRKASESKDQLFNERRVRIIGRPPLQHVPSIEDLIEGGLSFEEAREKIRLNYRIIASRLIEKGIPSLKADLFVYHVDWDNLDDSFDLDFVSRKLDEIIGVPNTSRSISSESRISSDLKQIKKGLYDRIRQRLKPSDISNWLQKSLPTSLNVSTEDCDCLICILWRHIIFRSESRAMELFNYQ